MSEQKKQGEWVLVRCADLPKPSPDELEALRRRWVGALVWFFVGSGQWQPGKVYDITRSGEVKIAVWRGGAWMHSRVIRFEYIHRVLCLRRGNS